MFTEDNIDPNRREGEKVLQLLFCGYPIIKYRAK